MELTPDKYILWDGPGPVVLNLTIVTTWVVSALLVGVSALVTRRLDDATEMGALQGFLEVVVEMTHAQLAEICEDEQPDRYLPFVGSLFLFIALANGLMIVPYYQSPTGSLSTATALAIAVAMAVTYFGIRRHGLLRYLKRYLEPSVVMLPFNIIGELSRSLSLAVRLFGNIMSGALVVGVIIAIAPLFFPILMNALGLLTGMIQAYIFAVLAAVYIASATRIAERRLEPPAPDRASPHVEATSSNVDAASPSSDTTQGEQP